MPDWKTEYQNFVTIPYYKLVQQLEYKAEEQGITVIKQDESHTSKCSFLDDEPIEHHQKYVGRRVSRGLFKSKQSTIINADVNGAYNILKKAIPNAFSDFFVRNVDGIEGIGLYPVCMSLSGFDKNPPNDDSIRIEMETTVEFL